MPLIAMAKLNILLTVVQYLLSLAQSLAREQRSGRSGVRGNSVQAVLAYNQRGHLHSASSTAPALTQRL
jgi:hypothetical protein